jgi:hypothetical protein
LTCSTALHHDRPPIKNRCSLPSCGRITLACRTVSWRQSWRRSVGRWVGGSVGRWVGGSVGRWVGGSVGRWAGGQAGRQNARGGATGDAAAQPQPSAVLPAHLPTAAPACGRPPARARCARPALLRSRLGPFPSCPVGLARRSAADR